MFRALLAIALLAVLPVQAQEWPTRPVRMIVPFPPGGGTDTVARPLAAKLAQILGQQVVIDNKGGAGGTIGLAQFVNSAKGDPGQVMIGGQAMAPEGLPRKLPGQADDR